MKKIFGLTFLCAAITAIVLFNCSIIEVRRTTTSLATTTSTSTSTTLPSTSTSTTTTTTTTIDTTPPANPTISIDPTSPTTGDVTVTITYSADSTVKQYKIGTGIYIDYSAPFTVSQDTAVYAKAQDNAGNWSGEVNLPITNIDKGTFNVTITLVTPTNQVIDFGTYNGTLNKNTLDILNVTATLTDATSFAWYLDGDALGVTTANCSINSGSYAPGVYNLTVYATKSGVEYSGTIRIKIEN